jgi:xylulokinase
MGDLYLGIDLGTQSVKASVLAGSVDSKHLQTVCNHSVDYDKQLPHYRTQGGVHSQSDGVVTVPTNMWIEAIEILLNELKSVHHIDLSKIVAVSGSGQQHGSVYWKTGTGKSVLANSRVEGNGSLGAIFKDCFIRDSPIWMDSSTTIECVELEKFVGGKQQLKRLTGSTAHERFTGPQIFKFYKHNDEHGVKQCERISLVSSFIATLFLGEYAPIDLSDGSGMNLLDVNTCHWSHPCLNAIVDQLEHSEQTLISQLGQEVVPSEKNLGTVSALMQKQFGFPPECKVIACSGDNPNSANFTLRKHGDLCISLGTSHTIFGHQSHMSQNLPLEGHYFISTIYDPHDNNNPNNVDRFLSLLCFKNGGLVRKYLCEKYCRGNWDKWTQLLEEQIQKEKRENYPNLIGFYYQYPEIIPHTAHHLGYYRFQRKGDQFELLSSDAHVDPGLDVLSLVESQFLALKSHAQDTGLLSSSQDRSIIVTGGASENKTLMQILADVFDCDVYIAPENQNSAAVGAACRAFYGAVKTSGSDYFEVVSKKLVPLQVIAKASQRSKLYTQELTDKYKELEQQVLKSMFSHHF